MRRWIPLFAMCLAAGCVGRNRHELVQIQLEATRTALSAQEAGCRADLAEGETRIAEAEDVHAVDQRRLEEASTRLEEMETELTKHREEHALWVQAIPAPVLPEEGEEPEPVEPMFQETVEAIAEALAIRSEYRYAAWRRDRRQEATRAAFSGLVEDGWAVLVEEGDAMVL
ncbi:MAG: hypothetical protein JRI25_23030, partial [Deltaproteobacteria bacterium]|nr:hypothetical protein [Deltaproteobacteria bacterium]